ncbi:MAG: histidine kinase [Bacteroidetes bacterium]|nr:histidine kinase [Bacteroidota bacterium]
MCFNNIHNYFPFKRLLSLLLGLAILIQLVVLTYHHLSGYYILSGYLDFFLRLLLGSLLSLISGFMLAYPDLYVIRYLNSLTPWGEKIFMRISLQLSFAVFFSIVISTTFTVLVNWLNPYTEDFTGVLIYNAMIYAVINILLMSILEGWIYYSESRQSRQIAENLREELSQIRFEVLKSQINPHFMFNSLNVLSGLINVDAAKAQLFIDEFSQIYRYVLETIEQPVVTLNRELEFMRSYLFLQQIRYGESLTYSVNIISGHLHLLVPPLSLQVLLENAMKHNIVNDDKPLKIEICSEGDYLIIKNPVQPRISVTSTGLGLKNLIKRYALISKLEPEFKIENSFYIARIPLIKVEQNERTDN